MKITNLNKSTVLADDVFVADNMFYRIKGLLGRKGVSENQALVIKPCNAVHSFFMSFPIDVLFVDKAGKIVAVEKNLKPWRISKIYFKAQYVIELANGVADKTSTAVGDKITLL